MSIVTTTTTKPDTTVHRRHGDWQTLSHKHILSSRSKPFAWGTNDCCTSVCSHIEAITGVDVYKEFRGTYDDAKSALVFIHKITGGSTVEDAADYITKEFAIPELKSPLFAQRGDVVLYDHPIGDGKTEPTLGIVDLNGQYGLFTGENGMLRIPVAKCRRAWRIGAVHPNGVEVKKSDTVTDTGTSTTKGDK